MRIVQIAIIPIILEFIFQEVVRNLLGKRFGINFVNYFSLCGVSNQFIHIGSCFAFIPFMHPYVVA